MPLRYRPPWVCQHVGPVALLSPAAVRTKQHLPDGVILPDLIVVQHGHSYLHLLSRKIDAKMTFLIDRVVCVKVELCGPLFVHRALQS